METLLQSFADETFLSDILEQWTDELIQSPFDAQRFQKNVAIHIYIMTIFGATDKDILQYLSNLKEKKTQATAILNSFRTAIEEKKNRFQLLKETVGEKLAQQIDTLNRTRHYNNLSQISSDVLLTYVTQLLLMYPSIQDDLLAYGEAYNSHKIDQIEAAAAHIHTGAVISGGIALPVAIVAFALLRSGLVRQFFLNADNYMRGILQTGFQTIRDRGHALMAQPVDHTAYQAAPSGSRSADDQPSSFRPDLPQPEPSQRALQRASVQSLLGRDDLTDEQIEIFMNHMKQFFRQLEGGGAAAGGSGPPLEAAAKEEGVSGDTAQEEAVLAAAKEEDVPALLSTEAAAKEEEEEKGGAAPQDPTIDTPKDEEPVLVIDIPSSTQPSVHLQRAQHLGILSAAVMGTGLLAITYSGLFLTRRISQLTSDRDKQNYAAVLVMTAVFFYIVHESQMIQEGSLDTTHFFNQVLPPYSGNQAMIALADNAIAYALSIFGTMSSQALTQLFTWSTTGGIRLPSQRIRLSSYDQEFLHHIHNILLDDSPTTGGTADEPARSGGGGGSST